MKKKSYTTFVSILAIVISILVIFSNTALADTSVTTVYIDNPTITATSVGQEFTVTIRVKDVTNLYGWQFGMNWNPSLLECTGVTVNYSFFGPEGDTIRVGGQVDNTEGYMTALALSLTTTPPSGITGDGPLAHATFKSKATGTTNIHLAEVKLKDPATIPTNMIDVYTVDWDGELYPIVTVSNLTGLRQEYGIYDHTFDRTWKIIGFNVTGPDGTTVFLNVTIPKALLEGNATYPWAIKVDDTEITDFTKVENATHTSLYFTYTLSTHNVEIWVVPEFPVVMIVPLLMIATFATVALGKLARSTKHKQPLVLHRMSSQSTPRLHHH